MRRFTGILLAVLLCQTAGAQELYPLTEPASNNPAQSLSARVMAVVNGDNMSSRTIQRHMADVSLGINKKLMVRAGTNFSSMRQPSLNWEGARLYGKYRFVSNDDVHKHFRLAAFGLYSYSRNNLEYNEINLMMGEQTGAQAGLVATQLWHKLAISGTVAWNEVLDGLRRDKRYRDLYAYQALNYSLSAGYLLLPFEYRDYNQTNLNLYVELLGGRNINFPAEKQWLDLAPSVQAIFNSTAKVNLGYRFQLSSDIYRVTRNSAFLSFEYLFLNALKKGAK
jgi:hypothetical protein